MMRRVATIAANFPGKVVPAEPKTPQAPDRKSDEKIRDNYPDMNELLVSQYLNRELETKGNGDQTQKCQEKPPLQISCEYQRQRNQKPLEAKGKPKVLRHIRDGRMIYRVTPMKELWHVCSTAPGDEKQHLWQCDQSCRDG